MIDSPLTPATPPGLTITEAALELRCSTGTIRNLIEAQKLAAYRVGNRWRVTSLAISEYISSTRNRP